MVMADEVVAGAAVSGAFGVVVCGPADNEPVTEYGDVVSAAPIKLPSEKNSTLLTVPSASLAFALNVIVSVVKKVAPPDGEVSCTVGDWFAAACTVTLPTIPIDW